MVDKFTKPPYGEKVVDKINEIIDNLGSGGITVDSALSTTSENPVQNKVITGALNEKADDTDVVKKDGGSAQQTISLSSGTGTTALGVKSRSTTSYISFSSSSKWLGSFGVNASQKPTFYNGTGYTLATTDDIPDVEAYTASEVQTLWSSI